MSDRPRRDEDVNMHHRPWRDLAIIVIGTGLLAAGGCGSGSGGEPSDAETTPGSESAEGPGSTSSTETGSESSGAETETGAQTDATGGNPVCEHSCDCEQGPTGEWVVIDGDTEADLEAVWVDGPGEVWVGGALGIRRRLEGQWEPSIESPSGKAVSDLVVDSAGTVHAGVVPIQLEAWRDEVWSSLGTMENCAARPQLAIAPDDTVFGGCFYYGGFARWTGADDFVEGAAAAGGLWALAPDHVIVAGVGGNLRYDGHDLVDDTLDQWIPLPDLPTAGVAVWASAPDDIVIGTSDGNIYRGDEAQLDLVAQLGSTLSAIWGSAAADIWAAGDAGTILHYDGVEWTRTDTPTDARIEDLHGDECSVWAVGAGGTVWRWGR